MDSMVLTPARARPAPVGHRRFLAVALMAYSLAIVGFMLRAVPTTFLLPGLETDHQWRYVAVLAAMLALVVMRGGHDSWRRVALGALIFLVATVTVAQRSSSSIELAAAPPVQATQAPSVHGVVLVTMDTMRRDRLSMYGPSLGLTPNLQQLAERSTIFENAYANSPYTLSSHASLFSGLLPSQHGAHYRVEKGEDRPLGRAFRTLAEEFTARGYQTAGIAANTAYLSESMGLTRGFATYAVSVKLQVGYYPLALSLLNRVEGLRIGHGVETWPADDITNSAIHWLEQHDSKPFFLFLNYMDAHEYSRAQTHRVAAPCPEAPADCGRYYDESVSTLDRGLGRLLSWMARRTTFDRTLIVITSDHGEYLGERSYWGHGHELHENVLRIPLIVKFPGATAPERTPLAITHAQLHSVILQAAQGKSLPEMTIEPSAAPQVVAQVWLPPKRRFQWNAARAVYSTRWKLIQKVGAPSELYNLAEDPEEKDDLFASRQEFATQLASELIATLPPIRLDDSSRFDSKALSPEAVEQLRALGYAGP
jgi:arylsulfatase A-like enzyme